MSMFVDRGLWKDAQRPPERDLKPRGPFKPNTGSIDTLTDQLDAFGLDDSGLFMRTLMEKRIPFQR